MMNLTWKGDLRERIERSAKRHEGAFYHPEEMFLDKNWQWPGDWPGRTLLAFVWHEQLTKKRAKYFDAYLEKLKVHLNEELYFGPVQRGSPINEQGIAGNSWFVRAVCKWYQNSGDSRALEIIRSVQENLFYLLDPIIGSYPTVREANNLGGAAGELFRSNDVWQFSTDIGCLYIGLDGIAHAYEILRDEGGYALLKKMIAHFAATDFVQCRFQVHATLSAARGILKFYETTGEREYLDLTRRVFDRYLREGMTANFANFNWFGRNEWTELCAIVDSFMLAVRLYELTDEIEYLRMANRIEHNALAFAQRENGGYGCDVCPCEASDFLSIHPDNYEAYWCCTMRGAEGLGEAAVHTVREFAEEKRAEIQLYRAYEAELFGGALRLAADGNFPYGDTVKISFSCSDPEAELSVALLCDDAEISCRGAEAERSGHRLVLRRMTEGEVRLRFPLRTERGEAFGKQVYDRGVLRLVEPESEGDYAYADYREEIDGRRLMSIPRLYRMDRERAMRTKWKILF